MDSQERIMSNKAYKADLKKAYSDGYMQYIEQQLAKEQNEVRDRAARDIDLTFEDWYTKHRS